MCKMRFFRDMLRSDIEGERIFTRAQVKTIVKYLGDP